MPRTKLLELRGTKYNVHRRIPTGLVNAEAYGETIEIRVSVDTSDRRKTERHAHVKAPDSAFTLNGQRKFFLEENKPTCQLRRYVWSDTRTGDSQATMPLCMLGFHFL